MTSKTKKSEQLIAAFSFLHETLAAEKTRITKAAVVQAYEMALELSWKWLKFILDEKGVSATSPKEVVRLAAYHSIISNPEEWIAYLDSRNLTSHTYNEATADIAYEIAQRFANEFEALKKL